MSGELWLRNDWYQPFITPRPGVPASMWNKVSGAFGRGALPIAELTTAFDGGRTAKPTKPILVYGPNEQVVTIVCGMGVTEMAEVEEMVLEAFEQQKKNQAYMADEKRERAGLPPREKVPDMFRQALEDRHLDQKRNPSKYHAPPPPDLGWVKALPEITLNDNDRQEMQAWLR